MGCSCGCVCVPPTQHPQILFYGISLLGISLARKPGLAGAFRPHFSCGTCLLPLPSSVRRQCHESQNRIPRHHFLPPLQPPSQHSLSPAQLQPRHWRGASLCITWGAASAPPKASNLHNPIARALALPELESRAKSSCSSHRAWEPFTGMCKELVPSAHQHRKLSWSLLWSLIPTQG